MSEHAHVARVSAERPVARTAGTLQVGPADTPEERQADRIADRVVAAIGLGPSSDTSPSRIRRRHAPGSMPEVGPSGGPLSNELAGRIRRSEQAGRAMDPATRSTMEGAFQSDFSDVRVHQHSPLAPEIQATAFTHGKHIHFAGEAPRAVRRSDVHTLAHELAHVQQQSGSRIRRKIGFEFEDSMWHPWSVDRSTTWGAAANPPVDDGTNPARAEHDLDLRPPVRPVARKEVIHQGTRFRLEGDDTPGPTMSNIEFVTDPFTEDVTGLQALQTALREMCGIVDRVGVAKGTRGPLGVTGALGQAVQAGPPWPHYPGDYVTAGTHHLSGGPTVPTNALLLSGGSAGGMFKMQATAGVTLADIPAHFEEMGTPGAESAETTHRLEPLRALHEASVTAANIVGNSPGIAVDALSRLVRSVVPVDPDRTRLRDRKVLREAQGYVTLAVMYLKGMQIPASGEGAKYRVMLLLRNKFSDLFATLDPAVQRLFASNGGADFAAAVLAASNAVPLVAFRGVQRDGGLALGHPLINAVYDPQRLSPTGEVVPARSNPKQLVVAPFTIGHFLADLAIGHDHLTATGMSLWLQANAAVGQAEADSAAEWVFESFGEYDMDNSGDDPMALLEDRAILPADHRSVLGSGGPMLDVARVAFNHLAYAALRKRYPDRTVPYPNVDFVPG